MHAPRTASTLLRFFASGILLTLVAGCGGSTATLDSGTPPVDNAPVDSPSGDTPVADQAPPADKPPPQSSIIYGPCRTDDECAAGLTCRTESMSGFPGGECNHTCTTDDDCVLFPADGSSPVDGWCPPAVGTNPRTCMRVCTNGIDCERDGYTCRAFTMTGTLSVQACIPVCSDDSCVNGTVCDHDSGRCRAMSAMPTGRTLGQTCQPPMRTGAPMPPAEMLCRSGICQADWNPDSRGNHFYSGWNGGYCFANCILPEGYNSSTFWGPAGMTVALPQADCPDGGICYPNGTFARGDIGLCLKACTADSDCRVADGYFCRKSVQLSATSTRRFTNGYCSPINCATTTTPCPTGLTCRHNTNGTGSCIPPTTMTP